MRNINLLLLLLAAQFASAQPYFARFYQFPDGTGNSIQDIRLSGDSMLLRMVSVDEDPTTLKTRMVSMNVHSSQLNEDVYLPNIEAGNSMIKDGNFYLLPSEERANLKHITLNRLDENFSFIDSVQLTIAGGSYYYFLGKSILYNDKYIVTGTAQNSTGYPFGRTVIFIVNKDLTLFDTITIKPVRQLIKPRDFAISPVDGRLYLSLIYDNFNKQDSTFVPAPQYQRVISLDSNFQISNFWNSEENSGSYSETAPIAFSPTGTLYTFYKYSAFDDILAINPSGQEIWKTPLDSFMIFGPTTLWLTSRDFSIADLTVASNGDILASGGVIDTKYNIGSSSFLARLRPNGEIKWTKIYRSNNLFSVQNYGYASGFNRVLELPGGDIVSGGLSRVYDELLTPTVPPSDQAWLLHADSNGCISPACGYIQDAVQKLNYLPIVSPANEWTVKHSELFLNSRRKYRFSPDAVLINGKYYYELTYNDSFLGAHSTGQFYREENGIVYTTAGEVVYDLNLGATDTLPSNQGANQGTRTVTAVGTTILSDNLPRKSMMIQCANDSITPPTAVVEGIGDLEDFFHSEVLCINPFDGQTDLIVCYSVNGQIIYTKPGESCDLSSTNAPGNWIQTSVYPNPADERLYIDISSDAVGPNGQTSIYNSLGICILNQKCADVSSLLSVDVSGLHPGCYWGVVRGAEGKNFSFAFVRASH